jgi:hypothetical protein
MILLYISARIISSMKKIYTAAILFILAFFDLFWMPWLAPFIVLGGIAVLAFGVETGPDEWRWKWSIKKES